MATSGKSLERWFSKGIAERVRAKRAASGLSQEQLGDRAKIHRTYIGAVERGEYVVIEAVNNFPQTLALEEMR